MVNDNQREQQRDEIIFSAKYSLVKTYFSLIVAFPLPLYLAFGVGYQVIIKGKYVSGFVFLLAAMALLWFVLDALFFKETRFYRDKVTKVWHLLGSRTIYYSKAKVVGPPRFYRWLSSMYAIRETGEDGKYMLIQISITYNKFFFPSKAAKKVDIILDYLTDDKTGNPRIFKKYTLNKEDLCQQSQQ